MKVQHKGKTANINLEVDLINNNSVNFVKQIKILIKDNFKRFNLDFKSVKYIDPFSLSNLIIFCDKSDLEFTFKNTSDSLLEIFKTIRLDKLVVIE